MSVHAEVKRVTTHVLQAMKHEGEKISMLTAYDYTMARILDAAGTDVLLVGDSASNVVAGHETTLPITLDQMIFMAGSVVRGTGRALVVVDLPFGSYQGNSERALDSAIRIMKESGAHAVGAELVNGLRREPEVAHHGHARREDARDALGDLGAALELHGVRAGLLHDPDGGVEGALGVALVGAEG